MILGLASANTSFYVGLSLGFLVVVVVVVLVAAIITFATRVGDQAHAAADVLETVRGNTDVLKEIRATGEHATAILSVLRSARGALRR
jgi:uncharacterized membrane protein